MSDGDAQRYHAACQLRNPTGSENISTISSVSKNVGSDW